MVLNEIVIQFSDPDIRMALFAIQHHKCVCISSFRNNRPRGCNLEEFDLLKH